MIDPAVKTAMGLCVLLAGVCAAMLFRHDRTQTATPTPESEQQLSLRSRANGVTPSGSPRLVERNASLSGDLGEAPSSVRPATVVIPLNRREPPPALSPEYPASDRPASSRWGVSMEMMLPASASADESTRTHRVVDGDTLEILAERYLGSAACASEIYEANRDALRNPELLPIGVELKIPPRSRRAAPAAVPLVPVR